MPYTASSTLPINVSQFKAKMPRDGKSTMHTTLLSQIHPTQHFNRMFIDHISNNLNEVLHVRWYSSSLHFHALAAVLVCTPPPTLSNNSVLICHPRLNDVIIAMAISYAWVTVTAIRHNFVDSHHRSVCNNDIAIEIHYKDCHPF